MDLKTLGVTRKIEKLQLYIFSRTKEFRIFSRFPMQKYWLFLASTFYIRPAELNNNWMHVLAIKADQA